MQNNIIVGRNLLETITSALYESPIILFREYVQNSLDAYNEATKNEGKKKISNFKVEITIDKANRKITILDNGYGIKNPEKFERDMLSFGNSEKSDRSQFIGFRGIGRIAALPFCETLIFENKIQDATDIDFCTWQGAKYRKLLNSDATDNTTFEQTVRSIVEIKHKSCDANNTHYFKVEVVNYSSEIEELMEQLNFEASLTRLLPIKYDDSFSASKKIESKYKEFMNEDLSDFMCSVMLNEKELRKSYADDIHVLDSDIIFWEIREKSKGNKKIGDKIGLLWFTFNKKMIASKDSDYGIMVRSKNVLMGNNDTFAALCANSKEHVATYSELTATLRGVYGELLINSSNLKDNARREWFKTDEYSVYLKYVIVDFMRRLYKYRYAASSYFRLKTGEKADAKKMELKKALIGLADVETNKIDVGEFCKNEAQEAEKAESKGDFSQEQPKYSYEDIPRQAQTKRKNYDELMRVIEEFFENEKMVEVFLKLRAYIKKKFND
jgi:molecular chaperone HtpG